MTPMIRPVRRLTLNAYRITIQGTILTDTWRKLVAELAGDQSKGDYLRLREAGRRLTVSLSIADLYRQGLLSVARQAEKDKKAARKARRV